MDKEFPFGSLSASQMTKWLDDPKKYIDQYYYKIPPWVGPELLFGRRIAQVNEGLQEPLSQSERDVCGKLTTYGASEEKIRHLFMGKLPVTIRMDLFNDFQGAFTDHKTGKGAWDFSKVRNSTQMLFYSAVLYDLKGKIYEARLEWAETENCEVSQLAPEGIRFTGRVESFAFTPALDEIMEFSEKMLNVANEICVAIDALEGNISPLFNAELVSEYMTLSAIKASVHERLKKMSDSVKEAMGVCDLKYFEGGFSSIKLTPKGNLSVVQKKQ